jgi:hypothetical protein
MSSGTADSILPARRPAGDASGALSGRYPAPAIGLPLTRGFALWDEFMRPPDASTYGDLHWQLWAVAGTPTLAQQAPTAGSEYGITRLTSPATNGEGGYGGFDTADTYAPANGTWWAVKVRNPGTVHHVTLLSGWAADFSTVPVGGASNSFIGIRAHDTVGASPNWEGVVRNGTNETTVDLGVAADSTWRILGFKRTSTGIQFVTFDCSSRVLEFITEVGSEIPTASVPTDASRPFPMAAISRDSAARSMEIDFWGLGGAAVR